MILKATLGIAVHGADLEYAEQSAISSDAALNIEGRARVNGFNGKGECGN
jgi:hypothetical protein